MSFWQNKSLQPKRKFRYLVTFGQGGSEFQTAVKQTEKPKFEIGNTPYKFLNHQFHFPNRLVWQPLAMTLVDHLGAELDVNQSITGRLYNLITQSGYLDPRGQGIEACKAAITKAAASTALGQIKIQQLADNPGSKETAVEVVETWTLHNAFINDINFGDLSYDDDGLVEISLTLVYDYATLNTNA